jgi:hypothetical protein
MNSFLTLPRSRKGQGRLLRRSAILDGTVPVLFSPYPNGPHIPALEWPPTMEEWNRGPDYITIPIPRDQDWPKAGSLLRLPQLVWLTDGTIYGSRDDTVAEEDSGGGVPWYQQAFQDATQRIAAIRPGRTFVGQPFRTGNIKRATGLLNKYYVGYPDCAFDWPLWGPPADVMDDFVLLPLVVIYVCFGFTTPNVMSDTVKIVSQYDTRRWLSRFPLFRCYPVPYGRNLPLAQVSYDPADRGKLQEPYRWHMHDTHPEFLAWASQFPEFYDTSLTSSDQITADWIVQVVADAFRFDPQTGKDLPPG